ncbi:MAG: single-stranded DNA-binding protein [Candidatus Methanomethylophilus sp.]|nr:single-stranded DNA-binding protein [Methanomethylophilus sp.]
MSDSEIELEPIIQELYAALDGKVTEDVLRKELEKYIVTYKTGVTIAKESILKRYSNNRQSGTVVSSASVTKKINELEGTEMNVTVVAKMIFVEKKEVTIKNIPKTITSGIAADDTGTAPFTIWSDAGEYEKGRVYTFKNAYTRTFRDQVQINIGLRGRVEPNDEVTFNAPSSSAQSSSAQDIAIGDITEQTRNVNVTGRISGVQSRTIRVKDEDKTVWGGLIADSTGRVQFTSWNDFGLTEGETISVKNAYIRAWKGIPQLNLGDRTTVERVEADIGAISSGPSKKTVEDVMKVGGGLDISITGTIVDIRAGSGLIKRCPTCKRSVLNGECSIHGHIEPVMDLRLKLTVDDGTGAISAILNRNDTEKITGMTLDEATELAKSNGDMGCVANKMTGLLLLKKVTVTGNIMSDEYGPQMSVHSTEISATDVHAEAEALWNEMEGCM